ncbi:potassium-transporting ATPase subunit KdpA [Gallaecimonas mangrovi]|uniref:potassium-transporting ATPase subunit KdpA n=1 Tax=Gallaecimonas mangrovi TaxID=2291597 RepID=UPI000E20A5C6|nr:potassium-transporting ATPase subunit KdpA [Gallaecimonas mangrovi]
MWQQWVYPLIFIVLVLLPAPWLGRYLHWFLEKPNAKGELWLLKVCGTNGAGQDWRRYLGSLLLFNLLGVVLLAAVLMLQGCLPFNPEHKLGLSWPLAINTAVSFVTNTNWQAYSGEAQLSYFSQMFGLTVQNFASAATGIAVAAALFRGLSRQQSQDLGNFWQDLLRVIGYLLLPLSLVFALVLVWQGVPQTFSAYPVAHTLDGGKQILAVGPAASQIAIKQLGTNGGGFFGVNSAYPFENPTALSNWLEMVAILLLPAAMVFAFGRYIKNAGHSRALLSAMLILLVVGLAVAVWQACLPDPALMHASAVGHWEGKESRFGPVLSAIWEVATSAASNGSVNAMHDSFAPLAILVALVNMLLGEVIFGGVGAGIYGLLLFVLLTVFLCGLMVGKTPTYLGKRLGILEMKWVVASMLVMPVGVLVLGGLTLLLPDAQAVLGANGPHGLTRLLYAYASGTGNNGSALAGFNAANNGQCIAIALAMLLGRYGIIVPVLAVAGSLGSASKVEVTDGDFPVTGVLFVSLLVITILIIGGLAFLPALALGPIAEQLTLGAF